MKYPLVAISLLMAAMASSSVAVAGTSHPGGLPDSVPKAIIGAAGGHTGCLPKSNLRLHVGSRTISIGTFAGAFGRPET